MKEFNIKPFKKGVVCAYVIDYYYGKRRFCTKVGMTTDLKKRMSNYKSARKFDKSVVRYVIAVDSTEKALACEDAFRAYFVSQGSIKYGKDQMLKRFYKDTDLKNLKRLANSI